jgi:hypothetical protein
MNLSNWLMQTFYKHCIDMYNVDRKDDLGDRETDMPFYLALQEIWRGRGRFLLFSMVIALITVLVLFVAALAEGLGSGNREYLEKLNADLIVHQSNVDLSVGASRLGVDRLSEIRRVPGVQAIGSIGMASTAAPRVASRGLA